MTVSEDDPWRVAYCQGWDARDVEIREIRRLLSTAVASLQDARKALDHVQDLCADRD